MRACLLLLLLFSNLLQRAQTALSCNAGADSYICPGVSGQVSASASGGLAPYTYHWEPAGYCSLPNNSNTTVNISNSTNFTLTVIDAAQDTCTDVVAVFVDDIDKFGAGPDKGICYIGGSPVTIGDPDNYQGNYTYSWLPTSDLSDPTAPNPLATPSVTTVFTVTVTSPTCGSVTDQVTVFVYEVSAEAGNDTTIDEGSTITLHGSGGVSYFWTPNQAINYPNTSNPDVNPVSTTTYYLQAMDGNGCFGYDSVVVTVRPGSNLFFYNTFTPNGDGQNDTWVIGNLYKYPENKLEIYNRYGQLIYKKFGYSNDWNGQYLGQELPSGTYYYYLDTNSGTGKFKGSVTIIR